MKRIAVVGASQHRWKYGNKCVRAYLHAGWEVYPVNLSGEEVEGLPTYRRVAQVPGELGRISVYLPPPATRELLPEIAERGAGEVWLNPGSADPEVVAEARRLGIPAVEGCSIVAIGLSPAQFP